MKWTIEKIIQNIKNDTVNGVCKSQNVILRTMARRKFGSWIKACRAAKVLAISDTPKFEMCIIKNCGKKTRSNACPWCEMHYYRNRRNGNPDKLITKQYKVDETVFDTWNDSSAWLLGLWWADGWMQKSNSIGIKSKDIQLIETVKQILKTDQQIKIAKVKDKIYYYLSIANKRIWDRLASCGCHPNKSLTIQYPKHLPDALFGAFYRGLIDGDGTIWLNKTNKNQQVEDCRVSLVSASKKFIKQISLKMKAFGIRFSISVREKYLKNGKINKSWLGNDIWKIGHTHIATMRILYKMMYPQENCPCLHRKKDTFAKWYNTPRAKAGNPLLKKGYRRHIYANKNSVIFSRDKWRADINVDGKRLFLGRYYDKNTAIKVRRRAIKLIENGLRDRNMIKQNATLGLKKDLPSNNTSGVLGVRWYSPRQKWEVQIGKIHIGRFSDKSVAVKSRNKAEELFNSGLRDKKTLLEKIKNYIGSQYSLPSI